MLDRVIQARLAQSSMSYRTDGGAEVDLILDLGKRVIL